MTEPIAVDVPAKPSFSRSGPGVAPGLPTVPVLPPTPAPPTAFVPAPKVESAPKPAPAVVAPTVVAAATGVPPEAVAPATGFLARFTKKQLTVGAAAALSLFAGVGAVRMLFPAKDEPKPVAQVIDDKVKLTPPAAAPAKPPAVEAEPQPREPLATLPPLPVVPAAPAGGPPPALKITGATPVAPPAVVPDPRGPATPPIPDFSVPPPPSGVVPASGNEFPKVPPAPAGGVPSLPAVPTAPSAPPPPSGLAPPSAVPPKVEAPSIAPPKIEAPSAVLPKVEPPAIPPPGGVIPPPPSDLVPKLPAAPPVALPDPAKPAFPPTPGGTAPPVALPDPTPKLPAVPDTKLPPPPDVKPPVFPDPKPADTAAPPSVFPVPDPTPKTETKLPPPPVVKPPMPSFDPPPASTGFTKPAGAMEVKPSAPEFAPKTTFDVDVHDPKANDTYETISMEFYNDRRFAAALRAYNQNAPLQGGRYVNVPPIHVLKRQFPAQTGGVVPVGASGSTQLPPSAAPEWGAAPKPTATRNSFTVPQGGMTLQQVAKRALGNEQRWRDIYDLNPQVTKPDELLPAGTELKLP